MAVRISRIKVNRGGPLTRDFELEPGALNVIYGHNETGKTYIVETLINLLFKTGARSPAKWNLREWDLAGRIIITGLGDEPVPFTKTGRKLDDYWEEETGLPRDFSRLLVVKAGETVLADEEEDGIGRGILKDYLSGEGLFDKIAARISSTLRSTTVQDRQIDGHLRGEVKTRTESEERLDKVSILLRDVEEGYASGEVYSLRQKRETIEADLDVLEKAKRHHAARLHEQMQALRQKKEALPAEEELFKLESDIRLYDSKKAESDAKSATLSELESTSDDYRWTENALSVYREIQSGQVVSGPKPIFMLIALLFLVGVMVTGVLRLSIPLVLCAVGAAVFFILYYFGTRNALTRAGDSRELQNLKAEFSSRFGSELTDSAALQVQVDKLKENHIRAATLKDDVDELTLITNSSESRIAETLKTFMGTDISPQEWRDNIKELRTNIKELDNDIQSLENRLTSLAVPEEEYLDQDPGAEWDAQRHNTLKRELGETEEDLDREVKKLDQLKARITQETGSESREWEDLITELRDKREAATQEYRLITAEILAKVQVNTVINQFREEENTRIADGLKRQELSKPIHALTGRYTRVKQEEDSGLVLVTDKDEEYPLAALSTGAREQVFLAMRIGFASIAMEGQTAFLVLDDAFQHSDWEHRENLVAQTLSLVNAGWQVFYFAMDDHIRDLFQKAGRARGDDFKSMELF